MFEFFVVSLQRREGHGFHGDASGVRGVMFP